MHKLVYQITRKLCFGNLGMRDHTFIETSYCYKVWGGMGRLEFETGQRHGCSLWRSIREGWNRVLQFVCFEAGMAPGKVLA